MPKVRATGAGVTAKTTAVPVAERPGAECISQALREGWRVQWEQVNPKRGGSRAVYEMYKGATTLQEALDRGAERKDIRWDLDPAQPPSPNTLPTDG